MRTDSDCDAPAALVGPNVASFVAGRSHDPAAAEPTASLVDGTALCRRSAPGPRAVTANRGTFGWRPPPMECPEENIFVDFVRGELAKPERARLETHLDGCDACSMVVAEMARLFGSDISDDALPELEPEPDFNDGRADLLDTDGAFSPTAVTETSGEILPEPAAMLPQGAKLGRYVVIDRVGAGGMGVVYAAYDPELDRKVALKVLRRGILGGGSGPGSKQRDRLMREAQAMAKLSHPNVITVHDVGTFEDQVFLAMEFIDGQTLGAWLAETSRTWREILRVFVAAGKGLAAAHAVGLVHRDFKPDNVLLGNDGRVLVTDFGLARPAAGQTGSFSSVGEIPSQQVLTASLTQTGALVGTPAYMAPEQLSGSRTGAHTDQFSFCVAFYEGLYGKRPFRGKSFAELASNVSSGIYTPPPRDVVVPRRVRRALFRGLSTDPQLRFDTMDALIQALRRDPWRPWRRWGVVVLPAGLFLVGAVAYQRSQTPEAHYCDSVEDQLESVWDDACRDQVRTAFLATDRAYSGDALAATTRHLDAYAERWVQMQSDACHDQVRGEQPQAVLALRMYCLERRRQGLRTLGDLLSEADGAVVEGSVNAALGLPRLEPCADLDALTQSVPAPPDAPELREAVMKIERLVAEARVMREAAKYDESEAMVRRALEQAEQIGYRPVEAEALGLLATTLERQGRYEDAETTYHRALSAALAAGHAMVMGEVSIGLVWLTGEPTRPLDEAERWATHGLAALEPLGNVPEAQAQLNHALAVARLNHGKLDEAEQALERVIEIREAAFGKGHHSLGAALATKGQLMAMRGRRDEAVDAFQRARKHVEHEYGRHHPSTATVIDNLSIALSERGDLDQARTLQSRALEIRVSSLGPDHPEVGASHLNIAATLNNLGRYADAKVHAERAQEIVVAVYGQDSLEAAGPATNLGIAEEGLGHLTEAVSHRRRALDVALAKVGESHPRVARYRHNLAQLLARVGQPEQAREELIKALAVREQALGGEHPAVGDSAAELAALLVEDPARQDEAVGLAERAVRIASLSRVDARQRGRAREVLAQALWHSPAHRDRPRADRMARLAREDFGSTKRHPQAEQRLDAWIAGHTVAAAEVDGQPQ